MLDTSARLLRLLSLLQTPRDWTGAELAERLGVSGRTVRPTSSGCATSAIPVQATRGRWAGTGSARARSCRRCCSTTRRRWPSRSACAPRPAAPIAGIEEASLRALAKLEQVLPSAAAPGARDAGVLVRLGRRRSGGVLAGRRHPVTLDVVAIYGRGLGFGDVTLAAETVAGHTAGNTNDEVLVSAGHRDADTALATWSAGHRAPTFSTPPPVPA